jgi:putative two-component system response regulator
VDDDPQFHRIVDAILKKEFAMRRAMNCDEAMSVINSWRPDVILLDIEMEPVNGYDTCIQIKAVADKIPQIVMVSGLSDPKEQQRAFHCGADDYLIKPIDASDLRSRMRLHFDLISSRTVTEGLQLEIDGHNLAQKRAAEEHLRQTKSLQDVTVFTLARVAESRDHDTGMHLTRIREYCQVLAQRLSVTPQFKHIITKEYLKDLCQSSILHDIGKVAIPDAVLLKPDRLTLSEMEIVRRHTIVGFNILNEAVLSFHGGGFLTMAASIALCHHERWNGTGYPAGLRGEEIPLAARITSVADVFDAITSKRAYKDAWSPEHAKGLIVKESGEQFDPDIVKAMVDCFEDLVAIHDLFQETNATVMGARNLEAELLNL